MDKEQINEVIKSAAKVSFSNPFDCYKRIIRGVMTFTKEVNKIDRKHIDVLAVLCVMVGRDEDIRQSKSVIKVMEEVGIPAMQFDSLRNYKSRLTKKGWLVKGEDGLKLNSFLMKAVKNKGFAVGLFIEG